jgi:hypothetical protein
MINITPKVTQSNCTPSLASGTPTISTAPQKSARQAANAKKSVLFRLRIATIGALRQEPVACYALRQHFALDDAARDR